MGRTYRTYGARNRCAPCTQGLRVSRLRRWTRIVPAASARRQSSHDPSTSARKRRGPSVGMINLRETVMWKVCRTYGALGLETPVLTL